MFMSRLVKSTPQIAMVIQNRKNSWSAWRPSAALATFGLLLVVTFAFGGSARGDELGLIVLRPGSAIALLISLYLLKTQHIRDNSFWIVWLIVIVALTAVQLVPLPPSLWHRLPGRELAVEVDVLLATPKTWRPISLSPELTRNALWSMLGPLACFLLTIQLPRREVIWAFSLLILLSLISGLISVIQISQGPQSTFYFYRITNVGSGVGFFANRNHQAVLLACMIPIGFGLANLLVKANEQWSLGDRTTITKWAMALGAVFVFSLVMVTGSRAGLLLYGVAMIMTFLYARSQTTFQLSIGGEARRPAAAGSKALAQRYGLLLLPIIIVVAVLVSGRADTLKRLANSSPSGDPRLTIFDPLVSAIQNFMPVGSGIGSFDPVFRGYEGTELLAPAYWNHAHNDWAEIALTGGVPALLIGAVAIFWLARHFVGLLGRDHRGSVCELYSFIGGSVLALTAISSFVEYPLRVPIMSCVFAMAVALISKARLNGIS
jgi:hypothetical protein